MVFVGIAVIATLPHVILRLKHAALAVLVYVWVLLTLNLESVLYCESAPL